MLLGNYFTNIDRSKKKIFFSGISFNSKNIKKDNIFFAIKGNNIDGNKYIKHAIKNGSNIIISEKVKEKIENNVLYLNNKNPRKLLAEFSSKLNYQRPSNLVAVTGTNGKSSIANFYYQILKINKIKVASIGTLGTEGIKIKKKNFKYNIWSYHVK